MSLLLLILITTAACNLNREEAALPTVAPTLAETAAPRVTRTPIPFGITQLPTLLPLPGNDGSGSLATAQPTLIPVTSAAALGVALLVAAHYPYLRLPYFWDELGQFIPQSLDLLQTGDWIPVTTTPNIHPPGVIAYLVAAWRLFHFGTHSILVTRLAMLALAAFGGGSMLVALALPRLLDQLPDRPVMLAGAILMTLGTALASLLPSYGWLLPLWFMLGMGYSLALTPSGRLLRRSAHPEDRPAIFAAQFALSHACWLVAYPLAGWAGARLGLPATALILAALAVAGIAVAMRVWPAAEAEQVPHDHPELPPDHPHLSSHSHPRPHSHTLIIDDLHPHWPTSAS